MSTTVHFYMRILPFLLLTNCDGSSMEFLNMIGYDHYGYSFPLTDNATSMYDCARRCMQEYTDTPFLGFSYANGDCKKVFDLKDIILAPAVCSFFAVKPPNRLLNRSDITNSLMRALVWRDDWLCPLYFVPDLCRCVKEAEESWHCDVYPNAFGIVFDPARNVCVADRSCPAGWHSYHQFFPAGKDAGPAAFCYHLAIVLPGVLEEEAPAACRKLSPESDWASLVDENESQFLQKTIKQKTYIGLYRTSSSAPMMWHDGRLLETFRFRTYDNGQRYAILQQNGWEFADEGAVDTVLCKIVSRC